MILNSFTAFYTAKMIVTLILKENANFFSAEKWRKLPKIAILTLTPCTVSGPAGVGGDLLDQPEPVPEEAEPVDEEDLARTRNPGRPALKANS
jgi:hypothetical protein